MTRLSTGGGNTLLVGAGVASQLSNDAAGTRRYTGTGTSYPQSPWQAYLGMWGVFVPNNDQMQFSCDLLINPATFPAGSVFNWSVVKDPRYSSIEGYMELGWGNYDNNIGGVTPRQAKNVTALMASFDWTFAGDVATGLLCECYLTTTSHASGALSDKVFEVGFTPKVSPHAQTYHAGLTSVGSFTDGNGASWNVGQGLDGSGTFPYFYAARPSYVDHHGPLDFKAYFAFLQAQGKITGNEWFNGLAFGAEPDSGAASFTIGTLPTVTYS